MTRQRRDIRHSLLTVFLCISSSNFRESSFTHIIFVFVILIFLCPFMLSSSSPFLSLFFFVIIIYFYSNIRNCLSALFSLMPPVHFPFPISFTIPPVNLAPLSPRFPHTSSPTPYPPPPHLRPPPPCFPYPLTNDSNPHPSLSTPIP